MVGVIELSSVDPVALAAAHPAVVLDCVDEPIAEVALLHLFNAVREEKGYLLIAAREAPARWSVKLPDLLSRLKSIPAIQIHPPDDATIAAVVTKLFRDRQISISPDVVDYAIARMPRTLSAARTLVASADREALARSRGVTVPLIRELLQDPHLFPPEP